MQDFFQNENKNDCALTDALTQACEGLTYTSETDAPVTPFLGAATDAVTKEIILRQTGPAPETSVEETTFEAFFTRLTAIQDWYGEAEKARGARFAELQTLLEESLRERKVFRIGQIRLDIYAVGIDKDGCLMGVTTKAVET